MASKVAQFLSKANTEVRDPLQELATTMKAEGDSRLASELGKGAAKGMNERGLLVLALALRDNGDERLWTELGLDSRVRESADLRATIESIQTANARTSETVVGRFLAKC